MEYLELGAAMMPTEAQRGDVTDPLMEQVVDRLPHAFDHREYLGKCGSCVERTRQTGRCHLRWMLTDATEWACTLYTAKAMRACHHDHAVPR